MAGAPGVPGAAAATARRGRGAGTAPSLDLKTTTTTTTWSLDLVTGAARKPRPSNVQQVRRLICTTTYLSLELACRSLIVSNFNSPHCNIKIETPALLGYNSLYSPLSLSTRQLCDTEYIYTEDILLILYILCNT